MPACVATGTQVRLRPTLSLGTKEKRWGPVMTLGTLGPTDLTDVSGPGWFDVFGFKASCGNNSLWHEVLSTCAAGSAYKKVGLVPSLIDATTKFPSSDEPA